MSYSGGDPIRVLHVDDDPDLLEVAQRALERQEKRLEVVTQSDVAAALDLLDRERIDCIVSDYEMPGMDGLDFLEAVRETHPDLPFILYTGKGSEEIASEAISAGVTEYLQKETGPEQYTVLANRIERAVSESRAESALEESERMLSTLISNLPGMVYRAGNEPDWPMQFVSEGCRELTGYEPEALESGDVEWGPDVLHPDDEGTMWETVQTALDAREPFEVTYRIVTASGETKWAWEQGRGVFEDDDLVALEGFIIDITERREAQKRRERYETIVESIPDGAFVLDTDYTFEFVNESLARALGRDPADLVGAESFVLSSGADEAAVAEYEAILDRLERGEETQTRAEFDLTFPDGSDRTLNLRLTRLEEDGEFSGVVGIARDLTERRERERELERYRTLVENVGDPMYALDEAGTITMVNDAMAAALGQDRPEIVGSHVSEFMPEADVRRGTEAILDLLGDDGREWATFEMETVASDGNHSVNEDKVAVLTDEDGEYAGSVGVIRDISERKERERELERYETIIQAVGDPVYALDDGGRFTFVNDAIEPLTGKAPADLVGEHVSTVMDDDDVETAEELVQALLDSEDRTNATFEMGLVTEDEETIPTENHMALLPFDDGSFRGTAGIVRDITERKEREQRLQQFASVVSHDLRNPLTVVRHRIELARETGDWSHLDHAESAADQIATRVDDLLSLAQQGRTVGDTESVAVGSLAEAAWANVRTDAATLDVREPGSVAADPGRLRELFENLFRNSVEHGSTSNRTESGDSVDDGPGEDSQDDPDGETVTVRVGALDDADGFYVADDGPGIPPGERADVFERGYSEQDGGTGFGLAIVESVAEAHGWTVTIADSWADGARFEVRVDG